MESLVKISQNTTKFLKLWPIAKKSKNLYSAIVAIFGRDQKKYRSSVLEFPAPYGLVLTKMSKCRILFKLADG